MKKRVFSGARPTGRQHLGNYLGAIHYRMNTTVFTALLIFML